MSILKQLNDAAVYHYRNDGWRKLYKVGDDLYLTRKDIKRIRKEIRMGRKRKVKPIGKP